MRRQTFIAIVLFVAAAIPVLAAGYRDFAEIPVDDQLQSKVSTLGDETLQQFAASKLTRGNFSMTLIDMTDPAHLRRASFDGSSEMYPASVVKLFFLYEAEKQIAEGKLTLDDELKRALRDMIVVSSNDATGYVVDRISGTTSGPELSGRAFRKFEKKRNVANRTFKALGYPHVNAVNKPVCEDVYGRERQLRYNGNNRNMTTSDDVAALMYEIVTHRAVSHDASDAMLELMHRPLPSDNPPKPDEQVVEFTGETLPPGSRLFSKAGWTSEVRHDATYVETPDGHKYIFVVFTRNAAEDKTILPTISPKIVGLLR